MSWRELAREFEAAGLRREEQRNRDLFLAWHIEVLHRQKELPRLKDLLQRPLNARQKALLEKAKLELLSQLYSNRKRGTGGSSGSTTKNTRRARRAQGGEPRAAQSSRTRPQ